MIGILENIKGNIKKCLAVTDYKSVRAVEKNKNYTTQQARDWLLGNYNRIANEINKKIELQIKKKEEAKKKKQETRAKNNKKMEVSVGLTFWVLVEKNKLKKYQEEGNKVIFYDNEYWVKRSRTNGEGSSYYLTAKMSNYMKYVNAFNQFGFVEYPSLNNAEQKKTNKFLKLIKHFRLTDNDEDIEVFLNFLRQYYENLLIEVSNVTFENPNNNVIHFTEEFAFDDVNNCHISSKFTKIENINPATDYVKENYLPSSCWLNLLVNLFKEPIEKYYKNVKITYQYIHNIIAPFRKLQTSHNGYSFNEVKLFFEKYKIALVQFDINMNVVCHYEPEKRNKHINPIIVYVMFHNKHIYHLNHNLKVLEQKLDIYMEGIKEICERPSHRYYLKNEEQTEKSYLVNNYNELKQLMETCEDENETIKVLYNRTSCFDLWFNAYKDKIEMTPLMTNGEVCFKFLKFQNYKKKNYNIYTLEEDSVFAHKTFDKVEVFNNYENKKGNALNNLLTINYLSQYNENVNTMLTEYMKAPLKGKFIKNLPTDECIHIDFNKYYTSILNQIDKVPVINTFDDFIDYSNQTIENYNLYYVEKLNNDGTYPFHKFSLCFGMNIKNVNGIQILKYLQVSKLKTYTGKNVIQKLYQDETLTPKFRKDIINHIVGKYNKRVNKKIYTSVSTFQEEANLIKQTYGGRIYKQEFKVFTDEELKIEDEEEFEGEIGQKVKIFINQIENESQLNEGFRLLSLLVYDIAYKQLLDLKDNIKSYGLNVYACNTDCLFIENDEIKFNQFVNDNKELFEFDDKDSYKAIGKLKVERKMLNVNCPIQMKTENIIDTLDFQKPELNIINIEDEFNEEEINKVIENNNNLQITAVVAGAGKTTSLFNYAVKHNMKTIIVAPYNTLCLDLNIKAKEYGDLIQSVTIYKLFGMVFNGEDTTEGKAMDLTGVECIVFDEIYLLNVADLMRINSFMQRNEHIKFYATGDEYQNCPIDNINVKDAKAYYNNIVSRMFPNKIILQENKRCETNEDRQKIKELSNEIRNLNNTFDFWKIVEKYGIKTTNKFITKKNVCAFNETCEFVNNQISNKLKNEKYFVGQQLICRKTLKMKNARTFINFTYRILEIKEKTYLLTDEFCEIELAKDFVEKNFRLPYARTCHSYQGLSENEPITIFNIPTNVFDNNIIVDKYWIYTAITRTTSLNNVYIFNGKIQNAKDNKINIDNAIQSHLNYDKARFGLNKIDNYITCEWICEEIKKNKMCKYCKNYFDITDYESFSVDRVDNNLPHTQLNCEIICRRCNVTKK